LLAPYPALQWNDTVRLESEWREDGLNHFPDEFQGTEIPCVACLSPFHPCSVADPFLSAAARSVSAELIKELLIDIIKKKKKFSG
jgi:hypothetical protein